MNSIELDVLFRGLRRFPDVEADNLLAHDATDRLLLDTAAAFVSGPGTRIAVAGDRYGALTLGAAMSFGAADLRTYQDLYPGRVALRNNAEAMDLAGSFSQHELGPGLLEEADVVLMQLPKSLAELEEITDAIARFAPPHVVVLAGGRVKHMTTAMNAVLGRNFAQVQPQLARQKSRVLLASELLRPQGKPPYPKLEFNSELGITVCAHGAAFNGSALDIGTRFLLGFLNAMPSARQAIDLGCGTGILAAMYALHHPHAHVTATDQSAAAVASAQGTAEANGLARQIDVVHDDAMSSFEASSADLILLNPPFHLGTSVHAGAAVKLFEAASRVLVPGGELWTVYNSHLQHRPVLESIIGPTSQQGRNSKFTVTRSIRR